MSATAFFLLLAVVFWTLARCARIFDDLAEDSQRIHARQQRALRDVENGLLLNQFARNEHIVSNVIVDAGNRFRREKEE